MVRISVIVENNSTKPNIIAEHGLSLFIEACGHQFFFDLGQGHLFAQNAVSMGINVADAEFAIVSHGHYDHGGGIANFMQLNKTAKVYLHSDGFGMHYSLKDNNFYKYIGLDQTLVNHKRIELTNGVLQLANGLTLFSGIQNNNCISPANNLIFKKVGECYINDIFTHEQSLIISDGNNTILLAGCAHSGILNIINKAQQITQRQITHVLSGFHIKGVDNKEFISKMAYQLLQINCKYYTCHCTGNEQYAQLKAIMGNRIEYATAGTVIEIE